MNITFFYFYIEINYEYNILSFYIEINCEYNILLFYIEIYYKYNILLYVDGIKFPEEKGLCDLIKKCIE